MAPSFASFGAGALIITSLLASPASADLLHSGSTHRIARHSRIRRGLPSGWESRGCITDAPAPNRVLQESHTDASLTPASCINACSASGYSVAGTQVSRLLVSEVLNVLNVSPVWQGVLVWKGCEHHRRCRSNGSIRLRYAVCRRREPDLRWQLQDQLVRQVVWFVRVFHC